MAKLLILCFTIIGVISYNIIHSDHFQKSPAYKALKRGKYANAGKFILMDLKTSCATFFRWSKRHIPIYYNQGSSATYKVKNFVVSSTKNLMERMSKTFPGLHKRITTVFSNALATAEWSIGHVHNFTSSIIEYASDKIRS